MFLCGGRGILLFFLIYVMLTSWAELVVRLVAPALVYVGSSTTVVAEYMFTLRAGVCTISVLFADVYLLIIVY